MLAQFSELVVFSELTKLVMVSFDCCLTDFNDVNKAVIDCSLTGSMIVVLTISFFDILISISMVGNGKCLIVTLNGNSWSE